MFNTAEIRKAYILNLSVHRLVLTPLILLAILSISFMASSTPLATSAYICLSFYVLMVIYYGGLCAASAFSQERGLKTWDNIRLSSLSAWDITLGKLFGSTLFAWYTGLICLLTLTGILIFSVPKPSHFLDILLLLIAGILTHAFAMIIDVQAVQTENKGRSMLGTIIVLMFAFIGSNLVLTSLISIDLGTTFHTSVESLTIPNVSWYHQSWNPIVFALLATTLFATWAILAVYRQVKEFLHCKSYAPWAWACFLIYLIFFINGFDFELSQYVHFGKSLFAIAFTVCAISTYAVISYQPHSIIDYRLLKKHFQARQWRNFAENIPLWWVSFTFTLLSALGIFWAYADLSEFISLKFFILSGLCFMTRDIGLILFFGLSPKSSKSTTLSIVYLLILYALLPTLVFSAGFEQSSFIFYPSADASSYSTLLPALIQAMIMFGLLLGRARKLRASADQH